MFLLWKLSYYSEYFKGTFGICKKTEEKKWATFLTEYLFVFFNIKKHNTTKIKTLSLRPMMQCVKIGCRNVPLEIKPQKTLCDYYLKKSNINIKNNFMESWWCATVKITQLKDIRH